MITTAQKRADQDDERIIEEILENLAAERPEWNPVLESAFFEKILRDLAKQMPAIVLRNHPRFKEWTGSSPRTMANRDSQGTGPSRVRIHTQIGYPRSSLLLWIARRIRTL